VFLTVQGGDVDKTIIPLDTQISGDRVEVFFQNASIRDFRETAV
jgi:hypothetical protein